MNIAQLLGQIADKPTKRKTPRVYQRTSNNTRKSGTAEMYERMLTDVWLTADEVAKKLGYTVEGARCTLMRYAAKGQCVRRKRAELREGRPAFEYSWRKHVNA